VTEILMGHANITTTMRYVHMAVGAADAAIAPLDMANRARAPAGHQVHDLGADDSQVGAVAYLASATPLELQLNPCVVVQRP
jgi:hypothetical protein